MAIRGSIRNVYGAPSSGSRTCPPCVWPARIRSAPQSRASKARSGRSEQLDQQRDVLELFAHVAGDTHKVGRDALQCRLLGTEQPRIVATDVQVADVDYRHVRPRGPERQAVPLEDRPVRLADD